MVALIYVKFLLWFVEKALQMLFGPLLVLVWIGQHLDALGFELLDNSSLKFILRLKAINIFKKLDVVLIHSIFKGFKVVWVDNNLISFIIFFLFIFD